MPTCWVLNPVVLVDGVRVPKVRTIVDSGKQEQVVKDDDGNNVTVKPTFSHSSAIHTANFAISFVRGVDFTNIKNDVDCICLLEEDESLDNTPNTSTKSTKNSLLTEMDKKSIAYGDLDDDSPWWEYLQKLMQKIKPEFRPKGTWVA